MLGKYGGAAFSIYGYFDIKDQYKSGEISVQKMRIEQTSNGIGDLPIVGTGWTFGWELGRIVTNIPGYDKYVRQPVRNTFGIETQW